MNTSPPLSPSPLSLGDDAAEFARRLRLISAGLAALVARRFLRMPHLVGLTILVWTRITRVVRRFERMVVRPARVGAARARRGHNRRAPSGRLPSGRGWLVRELGWEAAGYMAQLEALLADTAMRAVLTRLPGAGRVLRPLCRMLGVPAAAIAPAVVDVAEAQIAAAAPIPIVWQRVDPGGVPGGVGDCGDFKTK